MDIDRQQILEKLENFLDKKISHEECYQWALGLAVGDEYLFVAQEDLLIKDTIQSLITLGHEDADWLVLLKTLFYLRQCLKGEREYIPLHENPDLGDFQIDLEGFFDLKAEETKKITKKEYSFKEGSFRKDLQTWEGKVLWALRIYSRIFAFYTLLLSVFFLVHSDSQQVLARFLGPLILHRTPLFSVFYSILIFIPLEITANRAFYRYSFVVFLIGMIYYWYVSIQFIVLLKLNLLFLVLLGPLAAFPSSVCLFLLMGCSVDMRKRRQKMEQEMRRVGAHTKEQTEQPQESKESDISKE